MVKLLEPEWKKKKKEIVEVGFWDTTKAPLPVAKDSYSLCMCVQEIFICYDIFGCLLCIFETIRSLIDQGLNELEMLLRKNIIVPVKILFIFG